jgi:hypothetical protein
VRTLTRPLVDNDVRVIRPPPYCVTKLDKILPRRLLQGDYRVPLHLLEQQVFKREGS